MKKSFACICLLLSGGILLAQNPVPAPAPPPAPDLFPSSAPSSKGPSVPIPLQGWEEWAIGDDLSRLAPPVFSDASKRIAIWPSQLAISAEDQGAKFTLGVKVFHPAWISLPGGEDSWPKAVKANGKDAVVIEKEGHPAIRLEAGDFQITGELPWQVMPQKLSIPAEIGLLSLIVNQKEVALPNWDTDGFLWLKRTRTEEETEKEFLDTKVYSVLEDGIPLWLQTEIELSVAGKSREEDLSFALPAGFKVASVEARIPCAVEDSGRVRVQARAGKWTILIKAFRNERLDTVGFAAETPPMAKAEVLGFRAKTDFRVVELMDIQPIDVSQTTFPEKWRQLPVYQWDTAKPFRIEEKMRGMGFQKPSGLKINREFWLDEDGALMTFRDRIEGSALQNWRLDASPGQTLGAARIGGEGQLITLNPVTGDSGIELRQRVVELEAVGRIGNARQFPASGWRADVEECHAVLHLPPGWRLLALTGAERVDGDWLTNWTLLDIFLLLIFTMAVWKLWGTVPALIALAGFGLTFHEPGAPRYLWFFLLAPIALLRTKLEGTPRNIVQLWKYFALACLLVVLIPFVGRQLQGFLYPQLEAGGLTERPSAGLMESVADYSIRSAKVNRKEEMMQQKAAVDNLRQDLQARIQTGPAVPAWEWRQVSFGWNGPVTESEQVRAFLIPPIIQRGITLLRVALVLVLAALLLGVNRILPRFLRQKATPMAVIFLPLLFFTGTAAAQDFPPDKMLAELKARLLKTPDAFPRAAEMPDLTAEVSDSTLKFEAEIHAGAVCAVPLPGKFPDWSPLSVKINGQPAASVSRKDGHLWIVVEPGIHRVAVEGRLSGAAEWTWTFPLKPRRLVVNAPSWTVTGIHPQTQVPDNQVIFARKTPAVTAEAAYDRNDFTPAVAVVRELEIGLIWQLRSTLTRLHPGGKAVAYAIPLLPGERVLESRFAVKNGRIEVRLGGGEPSASWTSELPQTEQLVLASQPENPWVERWKLAASPVWNVRFEGLAPVYEVGAAELTPVWSPWPGENATLQFSRPQAVPGATMTVRSVNHETTAGSRQRVSRLSLDLQASLGQEFSLALDPEAEISGLKIGGAPQPVRRDGAAVVLPVRPGEQVIELEWKTPRAIASREVPDRLELPVESSNITTRINLPGDRWVLWTYGPLLGPAVRLWGVILLVLLGAVVLGRLKASPLRGFEWGMLVLGLTQVHPAAMLVVICWFFLLAWRGSDRATNLKPLGFNLVQLLILLLAIPVAGIVLEALRCGLLGLPKMMVSGNGSTPAALRWFSQRADSVLPGAGVVSVSIWYYRLFMLAWALWLAVSSVRWIRWAWEQFSRKTVWKKKPPVPPKPPEVPPFPKEA